MRVSDQQRFNMFARDVETRLSNFVRIQQEMASGKSLFKPSEDVQKAGQAMRTQGDLAMNKQYLRNIEDGRNIVSSASANLQNVIDLLNEIDSLAVAADNDTQTPQDRENTATQINQKIESLLEAVNADHNGKYLFGGHQTEISPYTAVRDDAGRIIGAEANQETIGGQIYRRIDRDEDLRINIPGDRVFQPVGQENTSEDIFYVAAQLRDVIKNNNQPPEGLEDTHSNNTLRDQLQDIRDRIITEQTYLGSIGQRLDSKYDYYQEIEITLTEELEEAEGADMADLATRLALEENVYNSLLAINSRILGVSLVDYIG
jgi:flagellar hook-associated protein 3 FlgL